MNSKSNPALKTIRTLATLSIIASSIWIVGLLVGFFKLKSSGELYNLYEFFYLPKDSALFGYLALFILLLLNILTIIGGAKLTQGNISGFKAYAWSNGIWAILAFGLAMLTRGNIILIALIPALFVYFIMNALPKLKVEEQE